MTRGSKRYGDRNSVGRIARRKRAPAALIDQSPRVALLQLSIHRFKCNDSCGSVSQRSEVAHLRDAHQLLRDHRLLGCMSRNVVRQRPQPRSKRDDGWIERCNRTDVFAGGSTAALARVVREQLRIFYRITLGTTLLWRKERTHWDGLAALLVYSCAEAKTASGKRQMFCVQEAKVVTLLSGRLSDRDRRTTLQRKVAYPRLDAEDHGAGAGGERPHRAETGGQSTPGNLIDLS
jgi:hypothetical protein